MKFRIIMISKLKYIWIRFIFDQVVLINNLFAIKFQKIRFNISKFVNPEKKDHQIMKVNYNLNLNREEYLILLFLLKQNQWLIESYLVKLYKPFHLHGAKSWTYLYKIVSFRGSCSEVFDGIVSILLLPERQVLFQKFDDGFGVPEGLLINVINFLQSFGK